VAAAAFDRGLVDERVAAHMPGGALDLRVRPAGTVRMKGPATPVFRGSLL
jgi:diaminopimelate epimerase